MIRSFLLTLICLGWTTSAQAYIDPGTTSAIFGGLAYILTFIGAGLAIFFRPIIKLYRRIFKKNQQETKQD